MNEQINRWITAYLENAMPDAELEKFIAWLKEAPANADYFLDQIILIQQVRGYFESTESIAPEQFIDALALLEGAGVTVDITDKLEQRKLEEKQARQVRQLELVTDSSKVAKRYIVIPRPLFYSGVAAAIALLAVAFWPQHDTNIDKHTHIDQPPRTTVLEPDEVVPPPVVARMESQLDAQWEGAAAALTLDGAIRAGRYRLTSGVARIRMNSGVEFIAQGPCDFALDDQNDTRLHRGRMTGHAPPQAAGFIVRTPTSTIVDLGTEFGVDVTRSGTSSIHVIQGKVRADLLQVGENDQPAHRVVLSQGSAAVAVAGQSSFVLMAADDRLFATTEKLDQGVVSIEGDIAFLSERPTSIAPGAMESDDHIWMFAEHRDIQLTGPLPVTFTSPNINRRLAPGSQFVVPQTVRCFILSFDPVLEPSSRKRCAASIKFDSQILGVVADRETWLSSNKILARKDMQYSQRGSSSFEWNTVGSDAIEISQDRRTLHIVATTNHVDQIRVIVRVRSQDEVY